MDNYPCRYTKQRAPIVVHRKIYILCICVDFVWNCSDHVVLFSNRFILWFYSKALIQDKTCCAKYIFSLYSTTQSLLVSTSLVLTKRAISQGHMVFPSDLPVNQMAHSLIIDVYLNVQMNEQNAHLPLSGM